MKRSIITFIIIFASFSIKSQSLLDDLSNYKSTTLSNGITIITVQTQIDTFVNYRFITDFNPKINKQYPGAINIITRYLNFYKNGEDQIFKNLVTNKDAVDSAFIFIRNSIVTPNLSSTQIEKAKKLEIQRAKMLKNSFYEHNIISRRFCFGKNNAYSQFFTQDDFDLVSLFTVSETMKEVFIPDNFFIIVVADIAHDTIVKYALKNFGNWHNTSQLAKSEYNFAPPPESIVNFRQTNTKTYFSANYPTKNFYSDDDFYVKQVSTQIFSDIINDKLNVYQQSIKLDYLPKKNDARFSINGEINGPDLYNISITISTSMRNMLLSSPNNNQINKAKLQRITDFNKSLKNPFKIAEYAYLNYKYNLSKFFFKNYVSNINKVTQTDLKSIAPEIYYPDNMNYFIQGKYENIICALYAMAEFSKVEFFDEHFRKYKIIPRGFSAYYIINDYLDACKVNTTIKNLTIKFHTEYMADTIYNVKGIIYKKYPSFYYFKSQLFVEQDSFLQQLQIANEEAWLDSSALGATYYTKSDEFWAKIYQAYIFPELYYAKLNYLAGIVCDTCLLNKDIFKIKVTTNRPNVYFYDYYDINSKQKLRTETVILNGLKEDTLIVVEYSNYQQISRSSELIMPFSITQKIKNMEFVMQIDTIDDKTRLKKKFFNFEVNNSN